MTEPQDTSTTRPSMEPKEVTDPRELRALTHPVRLSLLEVLGTQGPLTATQSGELIDESPTTCSFHLRQLAKYGFVEEAGGGVGRNRPWRLVHLGMRFNGGGQDPETAIAADSLAALFYSRIFQRFDNWRRVRYCEPKEWQDACGVTQSIMYVTLDELRELEAQVGALLLSYSERLVDPSLRPTGARSVEVFAAAYPAEFGRPAGDSRSTA